MATSVVVIRHPHFQTGISLQSASRSQPNFICSMSLVGDCFSMHFRKIASEFWLLWQLIGPIGLLWENACEQHSFFLFSWIFMKFADNNDMHKILDKFENWSDQTNNSRVTSPWLSKWPLLTL